MLYGLVDCNNFFVSCERVFRPDLNDRPVVVLSNNDGCVVSRSNEAKAMGIPMGMPYFKLLEFDIHNQVTAFSSNYTLYADMSSRVMSIIRDEMGDILPYSIDESFFCTHDEPEVAIRRGRELSQHIRQWTGIPVSIGLAPSKTLAKVACKFAKKHKGYNGACIIDNDQKRLKALSLVAVGDIWGIGRRTLSRLKERNINTALDFVGYDQTLIKNILGVTGLRTYNELQGYDCIELDNNETKDSICTSRSFGTLVSELDQLQTHVANFAAHCAAKLRAQHTVAQIVCVFVMSDRFNTTQPLYAQSANITLPVAASSTVEIVKAAQYVLKRIFRKGIQYKKAGVVVSGISSDRAVQSALFDFDLAVREKQDRISKVVDSINRHEGIEAVHLASQLSYKKEAEGQDDNKKDVFSHNLRREHMSGCYTTRLSDIMKIK